MMIKKFAKLFFIIDFGVVLFCILSNNYLWLINTQVAFISSLFISLATFLSYKRNVAKRLENIDYDATLSTDRDEIDKIDDPYDLYSEDEINEKTEFSAKEIKDIIKEEKSKIKQNSIKNTIYTTTSFISIYRVVGYALLVFGFFSLTNNGVFSAMPYLAGLFIVPLSMLCAKFILK
ncbi:hypothetical protein [Arcobacter sp.]|uniref:hypothetical protein n=1 Tax=Arcobacter sp. TaxID=1872629 RepID=UPI003D0DC696